VPDDRCRWHGRAHRRDRGLGFSGFNPHHRKDPSYYPLLAHAAQTGHIVAHNPIRSFQLDTLAPGRPASRSSAWRAGSTSACGRRGSGGDGIALRARRACRRSSRPYCNPARTAAPLQLAAKVLRRRPDRDRAGNGGATATRIWRRCRLNRRRRLELRQSSSATSTPPSRICSMSTPRSWSASRISGIAPRATGADSATAVGGRSSTWRWTTIARGLCRAPAGQHSETVRGFVRRAVGWFRGRGVEPARAHGQRFVLSVLGLSGHVPRVAAAPIAPVSCRAGWSTTIVPGRPRVSMASLP
jgi:hypothetical protein